VTKLLNLKKCAKNVNLKIKQIGSHDVQNGFNSQHVRIHLVEEPEVGFVASIGKS
jgi:hypothetical protein